MGSGRAYWTAAIAACWLLLGPSAHAEPLRLRADAFAEARAPAGLIVLQGSDKYHPYVDAEALVWAGASSDPTTTMGWAEGPNRRADILVLTMRLHEPHGLGELRAGRFVFATGAIRPIHVDAVSGVARTPWGSTIEAVGGIPTAPQALPRRNDWVAGGRVAQSMASRASLGLSYFRHETEGEVVTNEVGGDFATTPTAFVDVAGKGAYDLLSDAVAEASFLAAVRSSLLRVEVFGSHVSPGRLLPATSLFSVLGDFPSESLGSTLRWNAAPRLDLLADGAGLRVGGHLGGRGSLRATLRTDDAGAGRVGLEVRRQDVSTAQWVGVRAILSEPIVEHFGVSTELEIARPDSAQNGASVWPWGIFAVSFRSGTGWEASAALEAGATPEQRFESNALLRVSRTLEVP